MCDNRPLRVNSIHSLWWRVWLSRWTEGQRSVLWGHSAWVMQSIKWKGQPGNCNVLWHHQDIKESSVGGCRQTYTNTSTSHWEIQREDSFYAWVFYTTCLMATIYTLPDTSLIETRPFGHYSPSHGHTYSTCLLEFLFLCDTLGIWNSLQDSIATSTKIDQPKRNFSVYYGNIL